MSVEREVVEGGRRRRWSLDEKRAVVELSLDPDCNVAEVAACCDVVPTQIYAWRRELRELAEAEARDAGPVFLPAVIEREAAPPPPSRPMRLLSEAQVSLAMDVHGVPVVVAHGAAPELVTSVIAALKGMR